MGGRVERPILVCFLLSCVCVGCADNVNSLADKIGAVAARLHAAGDGSSVIVPYEPVTGSAAPYTVIFFPSRNVTEGELVGVGVGKEIAHRIYSEMAYLGGMENALVVEQEGQRLNFTTYWKRFAEVQALVVSPRKTGEAKVELRREGGTIRVVAIR
jgi:hypothetical protein